MSNDVSALCRPIQMPPTAKAVLMAMADYADDSGFCWPSIAGLCEYTCFGKSAVIEAIKHLERIGVVVADRKDRYRTTYTVHPERASSSELVHKSNMSGRRTSLDDGGLVRLAENEVRQPENEVRETDTNHQEPSRTTSKATTKRRAESLPCPDDVAEQTWADWLSLRTAKKAPVTETVLKQARGEARKAGMALDAFLAIWCARGSQGLQADWLKPSERAGPLLTGVSPNGGMQLGKQALGQLALEDWANGGTGLAEAGNWHGFAEAAVLGARANASGRDDCLDGVGVARVIDHKPRLGNGS